MRLTLPENLQRAFSAKDKIKTFQFAVFRPAGNDTGLIAGILHTPQQKKAIAKALQEMTPTIEQVGFVNLDLNHPELVMAGGEFCGNATSCAAYQILQGQQGKMLIKVSGVSKKLIAGVTADGEGFSQMPAYTDPSYIESDPDTPGNAMVTMEGITHYIDFDIHKIRGLTVDEIKAKARKEMAKRHMDTNAACGIIYVDQRKDWCAIHPIVYVRDTNTLYYETACGSGATALGLLLAQKTNTSIKELPILQPSGLKIKVSVEFDGNTFGYVQIQSSIEKLQEGILGIESMMQIVIKQRPKLLELVTDQPILEYLRPALGWKQQKDTFPYATLLSTHISARLEKLYGKKFADQATKQLEKSWVVETGAHLHIPRRYNNAVKTDSAQINSLLFQGQMLWALANQHFGHTVAISLNSGRVPLDNTNSGAYLDLPELKIPITLASKKKHPDSPQTLISARTQEEIQQKIDLLTMYHKQKILSEEQYVLGKRVLENFLTVQSSFSDQVATSHALMMDIISPIKQLTLDSELIGIDFLISLLKDKSSLIYSIFTDSYRKQQFFAYLENVRTGWSKNSSPFYQILRKDEGFRLVDYKGNLDPQTIIKGLEGKTLWPTGVMKFFAFMVEGGLLSIGGWTQTGYCTDIKIQSAKLLQLFGYEERATALMKMPTHIAAVGPCWGIEKVDGKFQLLDSIKTILEPDSVDFTSITKLTGLQMLLIATPTLYEFLMRESPMLNYNELNTMAPFAIKRI